jgi:hypothetical protein
MTIVNDDSRVVNKLETSLTDDGTVVIYDRHVFIVQATEYSPKKVLNIMFPIENCSSVIKFKAGQNILYRK